MSVKTSFETLKGAQNLGLVAEGLSQQQGSHCDDYLAPLFIAWQLNAECNLGCLHCCEDAGHSMPDEMNKEEVFSFLRQIVV